ncbi:MAG: chorismate synthase [Promethearchaeota archaeon]
MYNSFGHNFSITSFGESHGNVIGIVVDGCPSGLKIEIDKIQKELDRRRPGQSKISTTRAEKDKVEILSGVLNGYSTGAPICMVIKNQNVDSSKYKMFKKIPRPSHADYPALKRYGKWVDLNGSGRFSGRNTAGMVMAGAIAKSILEKFGVKIAAYTKSIYTINDNNDKYAIEDIINNTELNPVRAVNQELAEKMVGIIESARRENDSVGGIIRCIIDGIEPGIGEPMFYSLESILSWAIFSIPAVRGIEFGMGFDATKIKGSQHNDPYIIKDNKIRTKTNNCGGIIGGISNGMPITFNVAIKPTASIGRPQQSVDMEKMEPAELKIQGRHDPCIVPRAVPVIEAMAAIVIVDFLIGSGKIPKILS